MISYIKGEITYTGDSFLIIEAMGIGYKVGVSASEAAILCQKSGEVKIYTTMVVRDDGIALFGFSSMEALELFMRLTTVSGVGPKAAMSILNELKPAELIMAIISEDVKALSKAQGIGKKTAQRVILELKDKFNAIDIGGEIFDSGDMAMDAEASPKAQGAEALCVLGYSRSEAVKAVSAIYTEGMATEEILKAALKSLVRI